MQAKKRYALVLSSVCLIFIWRQIFFLLKNRLAVPKTDDKLTIEAASGQNAEFNAGYANFSAKVALLEENFEKCTMESCFNSSRCRESFKVHIYPPEDDEVQMRGYFKGDKWLISRGYKKILRAVRESKYYTTDPQKACIFLLSFDTLDRDPLSSDFVKHLQVALKNLPATLWNGGLNHVVFNLYAGTWPSYEAMDFGANFGRAILAKASFSRTDFRPTFDISLPLFHSNFPANADDSIDSLMRNRRFLIDSENLTGAEKFDSRNRSIFMNRHAKRYFLSFKGKRYTRGIGSDSRDSLYHLHNGRDVVILTTCKHGKNWEKIKDEKCDADNAEYDKWDYIELIANSTFCLIPRGRRLGTFRFLEALEAGCIPVILANGWKLPFAEVLDWNRAVVIGNETSIFQISEFLRSFSNEKVVKMRRWATYFYAHYFSNVEKIVDSTFEIIKSRICKSAPIFYAQWNMAKGGVWSHSPRKISRVDKKANVDEKLTKFIELKFTAIVNIFKPFHGYFSKVKKMLNELLGSDHVDKIFVLVHFSSENQIVIKHGVDKVQILTKKDKAQGVFYGFNLQINSEAIVFMDASWPLRIDEVTWAFKKVYKKFPRRLISLNAYDEKLDETGQVLMHVDYSETKCYSIAADSGLIVDRFYFDWLQHQNLNRSMYGVSKSFRYDFSPCFDLILNAVVGRLNDDEPPIKLRLVKTNQSGSDVAKVTTNTNPPFIDFYEKRRCFEKFLAVNKHLRLVSKFLHRRVCTTHYIHATH